VLTVVLGRALSFERIAGLDAGSDTRIRALPVVLALIRSYAPWGSGLGSFDQVYRLHEPDNLLSPFYLNHAHNDWLELALTGGLPAVLLLALSLAGLARSMIGLGAGHRHDRRAILLARVGLVIIVILGVASISDYPLRTPLLACLGATAALWTQSGRPRARRKAQARQRFDPVENLQPSSRLQGRPETHAFRNCR
jgi:O-antigen ligase